jgi:hypothetical protein
MISIIWSRWDRLRNTSTYDIASTVWPYILFGTARCTQERSAEINLAKMILAMPVLGTSHQKRKRKKITYTSILKIDTLLYSWIMMVIFTLIYYQVICITDTRSELIYWIIGCYSLRQHVSVIEMFIFKTAYGSSQPERFCGSQNRTPLLSFPLLLQ